MATADILERLNASRFMVGRARPSVGVGERRSRQKGAGMEFAEHRPYYEGDDVRHLDARVMARLNQPFIRQYSVDRQLPVFILIDATLSMKHGTPDKFEYAKGLARTLAFVGLAGGDLVQMAAFSDGRLHYSPKVQGTFRASTLFDWLAPIEATGRSSFADGLAKALPHLRRASFVIVLSDFLVEGIDRALRPVDAGDHELLALQVNAPDELDPRTLEDGPLYLVDSETGAELELSLDPATREAYRTALADWSDGIRHEIRKRQGRYFALSTATPYETVFLHTLRGAGVIT